MKSPAVVLCPGLFRTPHGKTAHGLVRGGERFEVRAVVDASCAGADAGTLLDGRPRGIPLVASIGEALALRAEPIRWCVVGVATHGGALTEEIRALLREAARAGLSIVNGLHEYAVDDPEIAAAAARAGAEVIDVRRPKPKKDLHFWTGAIRRARAPRLAVLGMDCALGKRTTARLLVEAARAEGIAAAMIYTGQTGWMQGARHGVVLDSLPNDFVSGELEHAVVTCDLELAPELIVLEGQSSLRNPSGPCGAELLLSAAARGVVLQVAPGRRYFDGFERERLEIPSVESEIALIAAYGARVIGFAIHGCGLDEEGERRAQASLRERHALPVARPLAEGLAPLLPAVRAYLAEERR